MAKPPVGPGTRVSLRFSLSLDTGEKVDDTGQHAASFQVGDGSLLPGFEQAMFGLRAGDKADLEIPASQGFGLPNEDNVHMLRKHMFPDDIELEPGLVVSFADGEGQERPGVVVRTMAELVEVDFNHPLAGRDLRFSVEILDVEQVSNEILRG